MYYAPGIISLIGFLFLLPYSFKRIVPKKETVITLFVPGTKISPHPMNSEEYTLKSISGKRKIDFILDGDEKTNLEKLDIIRYESRKLQYTFDTTQVIVISFTGQASYGDFVKIADLCYAEGIKRFAPVIGNSFIILGEFPPRQIKEDSTFTYFLCGDVIPTPPPEKSFKEKLVIAIKPYINSQVISLITGWIILATTYLCFRKRKAITNSSSMP